MSGRGIGMDVVKTNIELLGGELQLKTTLGQGSTFTIILGNSVQMPTGVACGQKRMINVDLRGGLQFDLYHIAWKRPWFRTCGSELSIGNLFLALSLGLVMQ